MSILWRGFYNVRALNSHYYQIRRLSNYKKVRLYKISYASETFERVSGGLLEGALASMPKRVERAVQISRDTLLQMSPDGWVW